ncbi:MAG: alpha/beta hydrolase, partial [Pseudomonadota bacterium]
MLHTYTFGSADGPTVLFLHGGATTSNLWRRVTERMPEVRSVLVDMPGHGHSNHIRWTSLDDTALRLEETMHATLGRLPDHVIGLSLGAYTATRLLKRNPTHFKSALLTGMTGKPMPRAWLMKLFTLLVGGFASSRLLTGISARMMELPDDAKRAFMEDAKSTHGPSARRFLSEIVDLDPAAGVGEITARMLLLSGSKEDKLIVSSLPHLAASFKSASSVQAALLPGLHHAWPLQTPDLAASVFNAHVFGKVLPEELEFVPAAPEP